MPRPIPPFACTNSIRTRMRCQMRELMPCLQVHARHNIAGRLREAKVNGDFFVRSCFTYQQRLYYSPQRQRIRTPPDELSGASVGKELIVFYSDRNIPFQSVNFVRLHAAPELFDQGVAPLPKLA